MLTYVTAGESHGNSLTVIVSGVPAGLALTEEGIRHELLRRKMGYGRGARQAIEPDEVLITGGVRFGKTIGSPVSLVIRNADWANHLDDMAVEGEPPEGYEPDYVPRPGHADLPGVQKFGFDDCSNVYERASARETAARVAAGCVAREILAEVDVEIRSFVCGIGGVEMYFTLEEAAAFDPLAIETSEVRCPDAAASEAMVARIDAAKAAGTTLGGTFCVVAEGLDPGLGSYVAGPERLTVQLGAAVLSIPAIKGVEFGLGFHAAEVTGAESSDEISLGADGFARATNRSGGLEGGMTTGSPLIIRAAMKPIPTQANPLDSVNLNTLEPAKAPALRSDVCAVPSAAVVAEAEVAFVLARAYLEKFGGDSIADIRNNVRRYRQRLRMMLR